MGWLCGMRKLRPYASTGIQLYIAGLSGKAVNDLCAAPASSRVPLFPNLPHFVPLRYVRSGSAGGPTSRLLFPMVGFKAGGDAVTLKGEGAH